jgi:hypothetical protein
VPANLVSACCHAQLAWRPCELHALVYSAVPYVLGADWRPTGDKEMLLLQVGAF